MSNRKKLGRVQKRKQQLAKREKERKKHEGRQGAKAKSVATIADTIQKRLAAMWHPEKIEPMETEAIINKLGELGIEFDEDVFRSKAHDFYSPSDLAEHLWKTEMDAIKGPDADFPWMAAGVLWRRLCPDIINNDMMIDRIDEGYNLLDQGKTEAACDRWLELWDDLKGRFLAGTKTIATVDERGGDYYSVREWLLFVDQELGKVGGTNPEYLGKRIAFASGIVDLLPESSSKFLERLEFGVAESHFMLGDAKAGDDAFQQLASKYPDKRWLVYGSWADLWSGKYRSKVPADLERARELYEKARASAPPRELEKINERIEALGSDSV